MDEIIDSVKEASFPIRTVLIILFVYLLLVGVVLFIGFIKLYFFSSEPRRGRHSRKNHGD